MLINHNAQIMQDLHKELEKELTGLLEELALYTKEQQVLYKHMSRVDKVTAYFKVNLIPTILKMLQHFM